MEPNGNESHGQNWETMSDKHRLEDAEPREQPNAAEELRKMTGRPNEDFEPPEDAEYPELGELSEKRTSDKTIERYDTGASVSVDVSRGTGTRDQEKWTFKGKGRNAQEALEELETQLDAFEQHFAERVRNIQPGEN